MSRPHHPSRERLRQGCILPVEITRSMTQDPQTPTPTPEANNEAMLTAFLELWHFIRRTLSLRDGIDRQGTMEGIVRDVEFRGHAAWILVCSVVIASIGLGNNSVAVIIGAMLISPLMGPILGVGLAAGTNDFELLKRSLINLGVAMTISIVISTIHFLIIEVPEATPELMDRKNATFLAIGVALFGGFAGIIAGSRPLKTNVFPGVAIATALMPPLCTVGYGLATAQWDFFIGAFYLFFINSVFIALPTYLYIKFVRFPLKTFVDPVRERRIRVYIVGFLLVVAVPSVFIFLEVVAESRFNRNARLFVAAMKTDLENTDSYVNFSEVVYADDRQVLRIGINGEPLTPGQKTTYLNRLPSFELAKCELRWLDGQNLGALLDQRVNDNERRSLQESLSAQARQLEMLRAQLDEEAKAQVALEDLYTELTMFYSEVEAVSYGEVLELNSVGVNDTIPTVMIWWDQSLPAEQVNEAEASLKRWLPVQLHSDQVRVWNMNERESALNTDP